MYVAYDSKDEVWNALDDKIEKEKEYHCPKNSQFHLL